MRRIPVSVIVMTKNEERNIGKCLLSVRDFSEVFVVDSQSTDQTRAIATAHGAKLIDFVWNGRYPKKKQWSIDNIQFTNSWIIFLDADEEMTGELANEIAYAIENKRETMGYFINLDYVFHNRVLHHGHRIRKLALFRHDRGYFIERDDLMATHMWEVEGHYQPTIEGNTGRLRHCIVHKDHDSLYSLFSRYNRYTDWEATMLGSNAGARPGESQPRLRTLMKRVFRRLPAKGLVAFLHSYVLCAGFLDGSAGFHYAISRGFYYWQVGLKSAEMVERLAVGPDSSDVD
ncbi:MAG: glycosyltransferase family 2 protein [Candidatus Marsarchaeota archaeon]|nr:glycosyltransferase family 2 protein [Candidatus Marsarchaeota archaeon]